MKEKGKIDKGGRPSKKNLSKDSIGLSDLDITPDESSESQLRAELSDKDFQEAIDKKKKEVSTKGTLLLEDSKKEGK